MDERRKEEEGIFHEVCKALIQSERARAIVGSAFSSLLFLSLLCNVIKWILPHYLAARERMEAFSHSL